MELKDTMWTRNVILHTGMTIARKILNVVKITMLMAIGLAVALKDM